MFRESKEYVKKSLITNHSEKIRKFLCEEITLNRLLNRDKDSHSSVSQDWSVITEDNSISGTSNTNTTSRFSSISQSKHRNKSKRKKKMKSRPVMKEKRASLFDNAIFATSSQKKTKKNLNRRGTASFNTLAFLDFYSNIDLLKEMFNKNFDSNFSELKNSSVGTLNLLCSSSN